MMEKIILLQWAPISMRVLQRLVLIDKRGDLMLDNDWVGNGHNGGGCRRVMMTCGINNLVGQWRHGESHDVDSIRNAISQGRDNLISLDRSAPSEVVQWQPFETPVQYLDFA